MAQSFSFDRREFLKSSAATGVALLIGFRLDARAPTDPAQAQEKPVVNPLNAWVRITPDNRVTLMLGKSEMGQGVITSLPMILAEELSVDWKQVGIEQAPTNPKIYELGTGGSGSVRGSWLPLRRAGAAAREMLRATLFELALEERGNTLFEADRKSALQEFLQGRGKPPAEYKLAAEIGPDHQKTFEVEVWVNGSCMASGQGSTKKEAEQRAAGVALERLEQPQ